MPANKKKSGRTRKAVDDSANGKEAITQDFFHPSEDKTANNAQDDYGDEEDQQETAHELQRGEIKAHKEEEYCEKRCFCCVCWTVMFVLLLCFTAMAGHIYLLDGTLPGFEYLPADWNLVQTKTNDAPTSAPIEEEEEVVTGYQWDIGSASRSEVSEVEITKIINFGDAGLAWDVEFPGPEHKILLKDRSTSVVSINYKTNSSYMSGIQFKYNDNNESPVFETESSSENSLESIPLSEFASVRKIGMAIKDKGIVGLRLIDTRGNTIVQKTWKDMKSKELNKLWNDQTISTNQKIIGFAVSTQGDYIQRFGWLLM